MKPEELEPGMEALLQKLAPNELDQLEGASEEEVQKIEGIAGRPLPRFYHWFLMRMGKSMGPFAYPSLDFSAARVISFYESYYNLDQRFLMIGYDSGDIPFHFFYDFDHPARDDARLVRMEHLGGKALVDSETFRDMLAYGMFLTFAVDSYPQRAGGIFVYEGEDVRALLDVTMHRLGFEPPAKIDTGPHCAMYERANAAMVSTATPDDEGVGAGYHGFDIGAANKDVILEILDKISDEHGIEVDIDEEFRLF